MMGLFLYYSGNICFQRNNKTFQMSIGVSPAHLMDLPCHLLHPTVCCLWFVLHPIVCCLWFVLHPIVFSSFSSISPFASSNSTNDNCYLQLVTNKCIGHKISYIKVSTKADLPSRTILTILPNLGSMEETIIQKLIATHFR